MSNNSLSEDIYVVGQLMADNLNSVGVSDADVDDGLTTLANKILNASGGKTPTILTLNTPMVVYTDTFTVTGKLEYQEDNVRYPITGATIQLIWSDGTEHIATGVTNSNGVFTFVSTDPASVSSYSFQLFFAGDNDYAQSNSSIVNVDTSKETSVLVITNPATGSFVSTDSVTVSGTLKDNDNTAMSGKSVSFSLNNVSAGTATVESDGTFSKTITGLIAGSNSISASFAATTTHTATSQSITVNRSTFDSLADLELIAGNQILSYADEQATPGSQYATLETQLMADDSPAAIDGISVGFYDYSDENNPVLLGSDDTDSTGKASFTYHSSGVGDVPIKAKVGSIVSKRYDIQDMIKYDDATSDKSNNYNITNTVLTFDTDHYVAVSSTTNQASNYMAFVEPKDMPSLSDFIIECDIKFVSGTGQSGLNFIDAITTASASQKAIELISAFNNNQKGIILRPWDASHRVSGSLSTNTWYTFKLQIQGTTVTGTISQNDSNVYSQSFSWSTVSELAHICIYQADVASTIHWKNLKIKPL